MTPAEYTAALAEAQTLAALDPDADTPDGARLLELVDALELYEWQNYLI